MVVWGGLSNSLLRLEVRERGSFFVKERKRGLGGIEGDFCPELSEARRQMECTCTAEPLCDPSSGGGDSSAHGDTSAGQDVNGTAGDGSAGGNMARRVGALDLVLAAP